MSDFDRDIWCLLGLPFDSVDMQQAVESVRQSAADKSPCFLSTPNLDFLIASQSDPDFRRSVINSDLSIADGMPLIWVARLLGIPFPERVTGSGLIEMLRRRESNPDRMVSVFFFGGEDGVAEQACQVINTEQGGLACAGFHSPGFGSISDMAAPAIIETINQSNAEFIIVSLGAKKGQAWIEQNREKLSAPVISHLGAVVNFVAGNVKRAPVWMQKTGLEWVWRIYQEPELWRRYFEDGAKFLSLIMKCVLPYAFWRLMNKDKQGLDHPVTYDLKSSDDLIVIAIHGTCVAQSIGPLRALFCQESGKSLPIRLDLSNVDIIDGAFLGLCLVLGKHLVKRGVDLRFSGVNSIVRKIFCWNCAEYLL
jgi:N-acetylglucosaminyldiphosphoundecaprenol N-acetyl-beta-D-mannosaminyltransferase